MSSRSRYVGGGRGCSAEAIKSQVRTIDAVRKYIGEPDRHGFIRCPLHRGDNQASLKVYPEDRGWYCFGCGKGGDVILLVMELFHLTFPMACLRLASDFGLGGSLVAPPPPSPEQRRREQERARRDTFERTRTELSDMALWLDERAGELDYWRDVCARSGADQVPEVWLDALTEREYIRAFFRAVAWTPSETVPAAMNRFGVAPGTYRLEVEHGEAEENSPGEVHREVRRGGSGGT